MSKLLIVWSKSFRNGLEWINLSIKCTDQIFLKRWSLLLGGTNIPTGANLWCPVASEEPRCCAVFLGSENKPLYTIVTVENGNMQLCSITSSTLISWLLLLFCGEVTQTSESWQKTYHLRGVLGAGCQRPGWDRTRRCWWKRPESQCRGRSTSRSPPSPDWGDLPLKPQSDSRKRTSGRQQKQRQSCTTAWPSS